MALRMTGKRPAEAPGETRMAMTQIRRLANPGLAQRIRKDQARAGFDQAVALDPETPLEVVPTARVSEIVGEERPQGRDEALIRPGGLPRALPTVEVAINGLPQDGPKRDAFGLRHRVKRRPDGRREIDDPFHGSGVGRHG